MNADNNKAGLGMAGLNRLPLRLRILNLRLSAFICGSLLLVSVAGCQSFALTDNTAVDRVLATQYWNDLEKQYSKPLVCWVVAVQPDARELYIGTNRNNDVIRIRACRVTADGRVWANGDLTLHTKRWALIK